MHVIDVMAIVMELWTLFWDRSCNACERRDGDGDGSDRQCYRIEAVIHMIDVMAMVMEVTDFVIRSKL